MEWLKILIVGVLATWQIVEIWHHSQIMAGWRVRVSFWDGGIRGFARDVLSCPYCLSPWVAAWVLMALLAPLDRWEIILDESVRRPEFFRDMFRAVVWVPWTLSYGFCWAMAVSRAANLANDLSRPLCRTPRVNKLDDTLPDSGSGGDVVQKTDSDHASSTI